MSKRSLVPLVKRGTRMSSGMPVEFLVHQPLDSPAPDPGRGVPFMLIERKDTPEGVRPEATWFDCTCDSPLPCIAPPRKPCSAKNRRQRRRDLARGIAHPPVEKGGARG